MLTFPEPLPLDLMLLCDQLAGAGIVAGVSRQNGQLLIDADDALRPPLADILAAHPRLLAAAAADGTVHSATRAHLIRAGCEALTVNRDFLASSPTNAQAVTQVKALTRQVNALIRLATGLLDGTD